jgi:hypothetical protein
MKSLTMLLIIMWCVVGQTSDRPRVRISFDEVSELVFPPMKVDLNDLYVERLMLRFSEPWMQIVIIVRTDGVEVRRYTVDSKPGVDELFRRANQGDTSITAKQIANKIHVAEKRITVSREQVHLWLDEMKTMRFSPKLEDIVCLDGCLQFDLSFDTRQDLVRYSVLYAPVNPPLHSVSEEIAQWMLKVRSEVAAATK